MRKVILAFVYSVPRLSLTSVRFQGWRLTAHQYIALGLCRLCTCSNSYTTAFRLGYRAPATHVIKARVGRRARRNYASSAELGEQMLMALLMPSARGATAPSAGGATALSARGATALVSAGGCTPPFSTAVPSARAGKSRSSAKARVSWARQVQ